MGTTTSPELELEKDERKESVRDHDGDVITYIGDVPITNADLDTIRTA